jgi:hypothetical protein
MDINALNLVKPFHRLVFLSYDESALCCSEVSKFEIVGQSETSIVVLPFYRLQLATAEPTHHPGVSLPSGQMTTAQMD